MTTSEKAQRLGLLLSCFDYSPVAEDEFHDWYDTEHFPERERIPGFLDLRRWLEHSGKRVHVATYDLASVDVLRCPEYLAIGYENNGPWTRRIGWRCIKLLRMEGEQVVPGNALVPKEACGLLVRGFNVAPGFDAQVIPAFRNFVDAVTGVKGYVCARLYRATVSTHRYAALINFDTAETPKGEAWSTAADAAWNAGIGPHELDRVEILTRRYIRMQD